MKVIIIKKYQNYEVDQIVEVNNGFGTNFLIKNGYALPFNKTTNKVLEKNLKTKSDEIEKKRNEAIELKKQIEQLHLVFSLKTTDLIVHGSITTKKINQSLIEKGIKLEKHSLPHISINSLGITKVNVKLFKDVVAQLKIEVKSESK